MTPQMQTPTLAGAGVPEKQATLESNLGRDSISHNANAQSVTFTTFANVGCEVKREQRTTWGNFVSQVRNAKNFPSKAACPLLSFALYGNVASESRSLKHGQNVLHYTGVVGDYDAGQVSIGEAADRLRAAGVRCVLYTSARHTPSRPRWRVIAPFLSTCGHQTMVEMADALNGALGGILAKESVAHGQGFYFGRVGSAAYEVREVDGSWLDDGPYLFVNPIEVSPGSRPRSVPVPDEVADLMELGGLPPPPLEIIASAAAAIPNDGAHPLAPKIWDDFRDLVFAFKAANATPAGRQIAHEWSMQHPKFDEAEFEDRWRRSTPKPGGIGTGTLFEWAKKCGWIDPRQAATRDERRRERQKAENAKMQESDIRALPTIMSVAEMEAQCVWIGEGSNVGMLDDPRQVLNFTDFLGLMAASATEIKDEPTDEPTDKSKKKKPKVHEVANALIWKKSAIRKTVTTRTFHAGAPRICRDPDGRDALNSWRPIERWAAAADIALFLDQIAYLFPDDMERNAFLDWLAHIEQRPGELPHYGWLHIASNTGTGRNWLASLLARSWRGQVAPNVDLPALMDSQFNGQLAGRIVAIVDEVQEGAGENPHRNANRLKSIINAEFRDINPKFGRQYREHNSCRWLIFSNHFNALPLSSTDRRVRVACHSAPPRSADDYTKLYAALADAEFVNAVGVYLRDRDIAGFNPGERPPMTAAKLAAVSASKSLIVKYAEDLVANWPTDVVTNRDAAHAMSDGAVGGFTAAMRRALEELDCESVSRPLKINGAAQRCWILRNVDRWRGGQPGELAAEAQRGRRDTEVDDLFTE